MKNTLTKSFVLLLGCHFIIWSLIPCLRAILPLDTVEAIVWGAMKEWGTNKHPPLSGWMAYGAWTLGGHGDISLYILNQICILVGFIFIYKIGKLFLSQQKAVLATCLMEGIMYYNFSTVEFNVNVVSLALWPACCYFFLSALRTNKWADWVFFGTFSGLNILNKYVCVMWFICAGLYLILTKEGRRQFWRGGLYGAALVAVTLILPHVLWLIKTDFFVVDYFLGRTSSMPYKVTNHLVCPVLFLVTQVVFFAPAALAYLALLRDKEETPSAPDRLQLFYLGILPLLLTTAISMIFGVKLKTMWGFPLLYLSTISLFYFFPRRIDAGLCRKVMIVSWAFLFVYALGYTAQIALNKNKNFQTKPAVLVDTVLQKWHERFPNQPLVSVGGHTWWTSVLYVYHPDVKYVLYHMAPNTNPWFNMNSMSKTGMMVLTEKEKEFKSWQEKYPALTGPFVYNHQTENWLHKKASKPMYYGFIGGK